MNLEGETKRHTLVSLVRVVCGIICLFGFVYPIVISAALYIAIFDPVKQTAAEEFTRLGPALFTLSLLTMIWLISRRRLIQDDAWDHLSREFDVIDANGGLLRFCAWVLVIYVGILLTGWLGLGIDMRQWTLPFCCCGGGGGSSYYDDGPDPWDNLP